jgi:hypothetical protein
MSPNRSASSRRSCSRTLSAQVNEPPRSAIAPGVSSSGTTIRLSGVSSRASAAGRWTPPVLASSTVKDLVAGSGLAFEDRGAYELKGIPGEWRLYAVER